MEFKEFRVGDLWTVDDWVYGKDKKWKTQFDRPVEGSLPVISGQTTNNGVKYYTTDTYASTEVFEDCLTMTTRGESGKVFYHPGKFLLANNVLVMKMPKYSKNVMLYLATVLGKACRSTNYSVYPTKDSLKTKTISLPVTPSGEIDFSYMEQYIEKIEKQYIEKIEKQYIEKIALYLKASGLDNYELTDEEKAVLKEEKEKKEFKIEDLFTVSRGTRHKKSNRKPGSVALVTAGEQNQGVAEYIDKGTKMTMYKNKITIDMFCNCFYRNYDFFCDDNILVLTSKTEIGKNSSLYIATLINKWKVNYNYGKQFRQKSLGEITISLPIIPSGEIDFDFMEKYISAITKTKIKTVVLEINKKLELYKQIQNE